ncbi:uncharacterized protein LOC123692464 [Colias croceus]|uniref:uncharacterized protein LOC123692464 n=1 Tax=Colias crocea TaxID=72248 RepID=UPI001E27C3E0|nr:uncharacterized protein LOC123692464 [Colias croceus]
MANEFDGIDEDLENLKALVRKSFARIYATLKARELKTLRQIDVIRKQCQGNQDITRNCVQNIQINYDNETTLLDNIRKYGAVEFDKLNFDNSTFIIEDYVSPDDDHMYSYKTIEDVTNGEDIKDLETIEEAALKEITETEDCVCFVNIRSEDVAKKFRDVEPETSSKESNCSDEINLHVVGSKEVENEDPPMEEISENVDEEVKKIEPTDDWLNTIKNQTETEPSQVTDVMEHSTITCS